MKKLNDDRPRAADGGQWDELEVLQLQVLHTTPTATTAHLRKEQTA